MTMRKVLAGIAVCAAMIIGFGGSAFTSSVSAGPPDESGNVERFEVEAGQVYDDGEYAVVTGPPFSEGCVGQGFSLTTAQGVSRGNGTFSQTWRIKNINVMVFEWEGDVFDLIGQNCEAIFDGDPETMPVEPIAVGEGRHSFKVSGDQNGVHIRNTLTARVTTTDGQRAHVNTFASFDDGPGGLVNLVQRINYTG
jgi:hypothetical protein